MTHVFKKYDRVLLKIKDTDDINQKSLLEMSEEIKDQVFVVLLLNHEVLYALDDDFMELVCRRDGTVLIVHEDDVVDVMNLNAHHLVSMGKTFFSPRRVYLRAPDKLMHVQNKHLKSKLDSYDS